MVEDSEIFKMGSDPWFVDRVCTSFHNSPKLKSASALRKSNRLWERKGSRRDKNIFCVAGASPRIRSKSIE